MEEFDVGPLTWVKGEIDQALDSVQENLGTFANNLDDTSVLRFSQTHLYQVAGALDMVGLLGCKRLCQEIENLIQQLEKKTLVADAKALDALNVAIAQLRQYLNDLLQGTPDLPMRLYPTLEQIALAQGQTVEVTELFFPDTTIRAPKSLPVLVLETGQFLPFVAEQRQKFQKSLLEWLKTNQQNCVNDMFSAIDTVMQAQKNAGNKTLWWVMTAFVETLSNESLAAIPAVKRLCRQIDQQLKIATEESTKPPTALMRDLLYFIGQGGVDKARVHEVKQVFALETLMPTTNTDISDEKAAVEHLNLLVANLLKTWQLVAEYNTDMVAECAHQLDAMHVFSQQLKSGVISPLFDALNQAIKWLSQDASHVNDVAIVEVATALGLTEKALKQLNQLPANVEAQCSAQTTRLHELIQGATNLSAMPDFATGDVEPEVQTALAKQIKESLVLAEQALDGFFRDSNNIAVLDSAKKPLEEVRAAFEMMELKTPASIASAASRYVEYFETEPAADHAVDFDLLAESLSALGMYVDAMPRVNSDVENMLEQTNMKLEIKQATLFASTEIEHEQANATSDEVLPTANAVDDAENAFVSRPFDPEMLEIFLSEAEEVLANVAQNLQTLRVNITDTEALAEVRRGYHTLKGSGRMVGLDKPAEVAWSVEKLLNFLMESQATLNLIQLAFLEKVSAAFADWVYALRQHGAVALDETPWQQEAEALAVVKPKQAPVKEEVLIDGTRKISRGLFNVFLAEAKQHVNTLQTEVSSLVEGVLQKPSTAMVRATHTLASNAGATGFKPILDLGRAFEHWLDVFNGDWTAPSLDLAQRVVQSLADMLVKVEELRQPKRATGLLNALKLATEDANSQQEQASMAASQPSEELANVKKLLADIDLADIQAMDNMAEPVQSDTEPLAPPVELIATESIPAEPSLEEIVTFEEVKESGDEVASTPAFEAPSVIEEPASVDKTSAISKKTKATARKPAPIAETDESASTHPESANQELVAIFMEEARELVPLVGKELRAWRANPQEADHPDNLQRALHTLKGSARMAGQSEMGDAVHGMEDRIVQALKRQVVMSDFDGMFSDLDHIGALAQTLDTSLNPNQTSTDNPN